MMAAPRTERIAEAIKKEVSSLLVREIRDPRIGFASITDVEVSGDLRLVKIFVSVFGDDQQQSDTMTGLESAKGLIRSAIGRRVQLRYTPDVVFKLDETIARGARINAILREVDPDEAKGGPTE